MLDLKFYSSVLHMTNVLDNHQLSHSDTWEYRTYTGTLQTTQLYKCLHDTLISWKTASEDRMICLYRETHQVKLYTCVRGIEGKKQDTTKNS